MPAKKKVRSARGGMRRAALWIAAAVAVIALIFLGYMYIQSRTVYVRYATVALSDLPAEFDGTTILFISDIDLLGTNSAESALRLIFQLEKLQPDILLLGGDYSSPSIFERLNAGEGQSAAATARMLAARAKLIEGLADFRAPMGKYAAAGSADIEAEGLRAVMGAAGIKLLIDESAIISRDGARIGIVGLDGSKDPSRSLGEIAGSVRSEECAIVLAHNPAAYVSIQTAEAGDGGAWADLVLSGYTHGGQIVVAGVTALSLEDYERRYVSGWRKEGGVIQLTTMGLGCAGANLRLGTDAEVHLITLRRADIPD